MMFVAAVAMAAAPSVTFDIQPRILHVGESATASLTFHGMENPANPGFPQLDGFQVVSSGTETSFSLNNGVQDNAVTIKYTLIAQRVGKTTIGPFTYDDGKGHKYDLPGVVVEVVGQNATSQGGQQDLFARLEPATTNLYVQQIFDLILKIYVSTKLNLHGIGPLQNLPAQGLIVHQPQQLDTQREAINGEIFTVYRFAIKAQSITAGRYDLALTQRADLAVQRKRQRGPFGDDFFDSFFGGVQTEPHEIAVQPLTLVIKDLPAEGRPPSFAGAVGQFTFDMTSKPSELTAGDPVTLDFRVAGRGNIDSVQMPALALGDLFKTYDAKMTGQNANEQSATGDKSFEQVVIPKSENVKSIPEVVFSFFDPDKNSYQTIKRGPFNLVVHPASKDKQSLIVDGSGMSAEGAKKAELLGSDIVYLKPAPREYLSAGKIEWYAMPGTMAAQAVPVLAVAATFFLVRRREKLAGDIAKTRRQLAPKAARAGIARARSAMTANDAKQFYEALWEAMSSYFGNRFNLAPGDVSSDKIDSAFARAKFDAPERDLVKNLFLACEQARFGGAPTVDSTGGEKLIAELEDALRACEKIKF